MNVDLEAGSHERLWIVVGLLVCKVGNFVVLIEVPRHSQLIKHELNDVGAFHTLAEYFEVVLKQRKDFEILLEQMLGK